LRIQERYLLSLTFTFTLTTVALAFLNGNQLDLFISLYIVEYFILTLLHAPFKIKVQKILNLMGYGFFAVFIAIVMLKVLEILFGASLGFL